MQKSTTQQLRDALANVSSYHAQRLVDPSTTVGTYPAPFLKRYQIFRAEHQGEYRPDLFYVGFAPGQRAYLLTDYPENYIDMAHDDGVLIDSGELGISYVTVYLEVTRSMSTLSYLVHSIDEVDLRPNLSTEEEEIKRAFIEKYRSLITGPTATVAASGYEITAYVVREQSLERHTFNVSRDGDIQDEVHVLEQSLPLVYGA